MKRMTRKLLSLILAITMLLSLLPATALADAIGELLPPAQTDTLEGDTPDALPGDFSEEPPVEQTGYLPSDEEDPPMEQQAEFGEFKVSMDEEGNITPDSYIEIKSLPSTISFGVIILPSFTYNGTLLGASQEYNSAGDLLKSPADFKYDQVSTDKVTCPLPFKSYTATAIDDGVTHAQKIYFKEGGFQLVHDADLSVKGINEALAKYESFTITGGQITDFMVLTQDQANVIGQAGVTNAADSSGTPVLTAPPIVGSAVDIDATLSTTVSNSGDGKANITSAELSSELTANGFIVTDYPSTIGQAPGTGILTIGSSPDSTLDFTADETHEGTVTLHYDSGATLVVPVTISIGFNISLAANPNPIVDDMNVGETGKTVSVTLTNPSNATGFEAVVNKVSFGSANFSTEFASDATVAVGADPVMLTINVADGLSADVYEDTMTVDYEGDMGDVHALTVPITFTVKAREVYYEGTVEVFVDDIASIEEKTITLQSTTDNTKTYTLTSADGGATYQNSNVLAAQYNVLANGTDTGMILDLRLGDNKVAVNYYNLTVQASPSNAGTPTGSGVYLYDTTVAVAGAHSSGYTFNKWTSSNALDTVPTTENGNFTIKTTTTLTAHFDAVVTTATGVVTVYKDTTIPYTGLSLTLKNSAGDTVGSPSGSAGVYTWANVPFGKYDVYNGAEKIGALDLSTGDDAITVNYYTLTVNDGLRGTATGGGVYLKDKTVTIGATPSNGYTFMAWTVVKGDTPATNTTVKVTQTTELTATYDAIPIEYTGSTLTATYGTNPTGLSVGTAKAITGVTITYALSSGETLPAGMSLNADGTFKDNDVDRPQAVVSDHSFKVTATGSNGASTEATWTINVGKYQPTMTIAKKSSVTAIMQGDTAANVMEVTAFSAQYWNGTQWKTLSVTDVATVGTVAYTPTTFTAAGTGKSVTGAIADGSYTGIYGNIYKAVSATTTVDVTATYTVTVTDKLDGAKVTDSAKVITLVKGGTPISGGAPSSGVTTFSNVPADTYEVHVGSDDTGVKFVVSGAGNLDLNYYTVKFAATPSGGAYTAGSAPSDSTVLVGGTANNVNLPPLTANTNFKFDQWTQDKTGAGAFDTTTDPATWTIGSYTGSGPITLTPTFTRTGYKATVTVNVNGAHVSNGIAVVLKDGDTVVETVNTDNNGVAVFNNLSAKAYTLTVTGKGGSQSFTITNADATVALNYYTLTVSGGSNSTGTATGGGDYLTGATATVGGVAPASGYRAASPAWKVTTTNGSTVSGTTVTVSGQDTVTYQTVANTVTVTTKLNGAGADHGIVALHPASGGDISGSGAGGVYTFSAVPNGTYAIYVSGAPTGVTGITVNNSDPTATLSYYEVSLGTISNGNATIDGGTNAVTVLVGGTKKSVDLTATGATNYTFNKWAASSSAGSFGSTTDAATTWSVGTYAGTGAITLTPSFLKSAYSAKVHLSLDTADLAGYTISLTDGTDTFTSAAATDANGVATVNGLKASKTYTATAAGGGATLNGGVSVAIVTSDITTPVEMAYYSVSITGDTAHGSVSGTVGGAAATGGNYVNGTALANVTATPTPNNGYVFDKWTATNGASDTTGITVPSAINGAAVTLYARFKQAAISFATPATQTAVYGTSKTLTIDAATVANGAITGYTTSALPDGVTFDSATRTFTFKVHAVDTTGTNITVTATSVSGLTEDVTFKLTTNKATPTFSVSAKDGDHLAGQNTSDAMTLSLKGDYWDGGNWVEITDVTNATITGITYTDAKLSTSKSYSAEITAFSATYADLWNLPAAASCPITVKAAHDVTVTAMLDTATDAYTGLTADVSLKTGATVVAGPTALTNGTVSFASVPDSATAYDIYFGAEKVGTVLVSGADKTAVIQYYTLTVNGDAHSTGAVTGGGVYRAGTHATVGGMSAVSGYRAASPAWIVTTGASTVSGTDVTVNSVSTVTYQTVANTVKVTTKLNGADSATPGVVTLHPASGGDISGSGAGGVYTFTGVPNGDYDVFVGDAATGVAKVTVNNSDPTATLKYYGVSLGASSNGSAAIDGGTDAVTVLVGGTKNSVGLTATPSNSNYSFGTWAQSATAGDFTSAATVAANTWTIKGDYAGTGAITLTPSFVKTAYSAKVHLTLDTANQAGYTISLTDGTDTFTSAAATDANGVATVDGLKPNTTYTATATGAATLNGGVSVAIVTSDITATPVEMAYFTLAWGAVTPAGAGTLDSGNTPAGIYVNGTEITAKIGTTTTGYAFEKWTNSADSDSAITVSANKFNLTKKTTVVANFSVPAFTFAPAALGDLVYGAASYTASTATATGGSGNFTYSLETGHGMPDWLDFTDGALTLTAANTTGDVGNYAFTVTATDTVTGRSQTAEFTVPVVKASINAVAVTDITAPNLLDALDTDYITNPLPAAGFTKGAISWSPSAANQPDTAYTATVVLTADGNHKFVAGAYTINGAANGSDADHGSVTVNVTAAAVTLTYTFPKTALSAPTGLSVTAAGTDYKAGEISTLTTATGANVKYYYVVTSTAQASLSADAVATAAGGGTAVTDQVAYGTAAGTLNNAGDLSSYAAYYVYAAARSESGGNTSAWTAVANTTFKTFHKVTVLHDGNGAITAPAAGGTATTNGYIIGVPDGTALTVTATAQVGNYAFDAWSTGVVDTTANSTTYTPTAASAAEVTLTASYVPTYGVAYDLQGGSGTAPTDTGNYKDGAAVTFKSYTGTKTGYTFLGWNTDEDATTKLDSYTMAHGTLNPGEAVTLYAIWKAVGIQITDPAVNDGVYGTVYTASARPTVTYVGGGAVSGMTFAIDTTGMTAGAGTLGLPGGLVINANTGVISGDTTGNIAGKPFAQPGDYSFKIKATAPNGQTAATVELTIKIDKADVDFTPSYTLAQGDVDYGGKAALGTVGGTATGPKWESSDWTPAANVAGSAAYTSGTAPTLVDGDNTVSTTFTPTDAVYYKTAAENITINAKVKTYGFKLIGAADATTVSSVQLDSKTYGYAAAPSAGFRVQNTGNQGIDLTYTLTVGDTKFALADTVAHLDGKETADDVISAVITISAKTGLAAGTHNGTLTVSDGTAARDQNIAITFKVTEAPITVAAILVDEPALGTALDTGATIDNTSAPAASFTAGTVAWAPNDVTPVKGQSYTATVTLTPATNYAFDLATYTDAYTLNTKADKDAEVTARMSGKNLELTYTFPVTAIDLTSVTAGATGGSDGTSASITKLVGDSAKTLTFYYVVTTSAAAPTAAQIVAGTDENNAPATASDNMTANGGTTDTWTGNRAITGLANGVTYYVHAVAQAAGATDYSRVISPDFTTYYKVEMAVNNAAMGTTAPNTTQYVKPGEGLTINASPKSNSYLFTTWAADDGADGSFKDNDATKAGNVFTPAANTTLTATFKGIPVLKIDGATGGGNEVPSDYVAASTEVLNGTVGNIGAANMTGDLAYKIVDKGAAFDGTPNANFTVALGSADPLNMSATTAIVAKPVDGLTAGNTYEATIWVYEAGVATTVPVSVDVKLVVVGAADPVINPATRKWNLAAGVNNGDWKPILTEKGYSTIESIELLDGDNGSVVSTLGQGSDYTLNRTTTPPAESDATGVTEITITETYLKTLESGKAAGDKVYFKVTLKWYDTTNTTPKYKQLEMTYEDSTPSITGVTITPAAGLHAGVELTANATATSGVVSTTNATYEWYRTTADNTDKTTKISGVTNSEIYTLTGDDEGYMIFVVVTGNDTALKGDAASAVTEKVKLTIQFKAAPAAGGSVTSPTDATVYADAGDVISGITGTSNSGYAFKNWTVTADGDGTFASDTAATTNFTVAKSTAVTANFNKLPTLTYADGADSATYNVGSAGSGDLALTYTVNNGTFASIVINGKTLTASDYTATGTAYVIKRDWLVANMTTAGDFTVGFTTTEGGVYNTAVDLTITKVNLAMPAHTIVNNDGDAAITAAGLAAGVTLKDKPATGADVASYQWYLGVAAGLTIADMADTNKATALTATQTYALTKAFVDANHGKYLYVVATGKGDYAGATELDSIGPIPTPEYEVTAAAAPTAGGTATVNTKGSDTVALGGTVNLAATENTGYLFTGWTTDETGNFGDAAKANTTFAPEEDATVTANFDLLPKLTIANAVYNVGGDASNKVLPGMDYAQNDGSGDTLIHIIGSTFVSEDDNARGYIVLTGVGDDVLTENWMKANLGAGTYTVKVYDTTKGATTDGDAANDAGNARYDVSVTLKVENVNKTLPNYKIVKKTDLTFGGTEAGADYLVWGNTVKANPVTEVTTAAGDEPTYLWFYGDPGLSLGDLENPILATPITDGTDPITTQTLAIDNALQTALVGKQLYAKVTGHGDYAGSDKMDDAGPVPTPEYTVTAAVDPGGSGTATAGGGATATVSLGNTVELAATPAAGYVFAGWTTDDDGAIGDADAATTTFAPTEDATVTANFKPGTITFADGEGEAQYMTQTLAAAPTVAASSSAATAAFTYAKATATTDDYGEGKVPAYTWPEWLAIAADGTLSVDAGKWVNTNVAKDSATEVTVYIKATQGGSGNSKVAKFTIDVTPGDLTATAPSYAKTGSESQGDPIDLTKFSATVKNAKDETLDNTATTANGDWSVSSATFTGTKETYTFTYTAKANADGSNNYKTATVELEIEVDALKESIGVKDDADPEQTFGTPRTREADQVYGAPTTTYTVNVKNTGNKDLYRLAVEISGANKDAFTVTDGGVTGDLGSGDTHGKDIKLVLADTAITPDDYVVAVTVTGNTKADGTGNAVTASYTLTVTVVDANYTVTAETEDLSADSSGKYGGTVKVNTDAAGATSSATIKYPTTKSVTLTAVPADGYKFDHWEAQTGDGTFGSDTGVEDANKNATTTFFPADGKDDVTVTAVFVPGTITFEGDDGAAKYMTQALTTAPTVSAASDAAGTTFTYAKATEDGWPTWLKLDADGTLSVDAGKWVDTDVVAGSATEVTVSIKATEAKSGATATAEFTIDVTPGDLTATDPAYGGSSQTVGDPINLDDFSATVKNKRDDVIPAAAGTWTVVDGDGNEVENPTFTGTKVTYQFKFTPNSPNYNSVTVELEITAAEPIAPTYTLTVKDTDVPYDSKDFGELVFGSTPTGMVVTITNTGNQTLYGVKLTEGGEKGKFTLSDVATGLDTGVTLAPGETATFTVTPKTDVVGGAFTATYTVTSKRTAAAATDDGPSATYTATVKVTPVVIGDPQVTVPDPEINKDFPNKDDVTVTDKNGADVADNVDVTIKWQEQKPDGTWDDTKDGKPQPGKDYRPVVVVTPDGNHKLDDAIDDETINGDKNTEHGAEIKQENGSDTFTGAPTHIPGTPVLKFQDVKVGDSSDKKDPAVNVTRNVSIYTGDTLGEYTVTLSNSVDTIYDVSVTSTSSLADKINLTPNHFDQMSKTDTQSYTLDLSKVDTSGAYTGMVIVTATGKTAAGANVVATYTFNLSIANKPVNPPSGGGGGGGSTSFTVTYDIAKDLGSTKDKTVEKVAEGEKPANVPAVTSKDAEKDIFVGWTLDPKAEKIVLTEPTEKIITENTTFYAVFAPIGEHEHYIKGYDTGVFAPADDISRAQVAAIIARACLDGFREDNDYGNGGYHDVADSHWARSAIAYCTEKGVFVGVGEGAFEPDRPITRQEFALVFSRMAGLQTAGDMPFTDAATTADWAVDGVYTAYHNGWVIGYADGTFKPWNNIARSEAVKIVNHYLNRGVDAAGIKDVAGALKQWPDVPETYWAYYEIIESSNDHTYYYTTGTTPPEHFTKAYIEEASWGK